MDQDEINDIIIKLTPRQYQVFKLVGSGKTSKEIAAELNITEKTVQNLRYKICDKLDLEGYGALFQCALKIRVKNGRNS